MSKTKLAWYLKPPPKPEGFTDYNGWVVAVALWAADRPCSCKCDQKSEPSK